ncbi:MAG: hypothetical protein DHS20C14_00860 [Phycisphaeraceae bacterium]|nr:MAG: hypothetical protein DHS20C14_00860 [Phycisphaeraceae bacterium]
MLLIDAYNVIGARWCLPRDQRGLDVPGLISWIERSPRFGKRRARVVCDGRPGPGWDRAGLLDTAGGMAWTRLGRTEVVFSGKGREADDVIEDVLARSKGIAILMVSSDRRLIRAARAAKAEQIGNGTFLKALAADTRGQDHSDRPAFATEVPLNSGSVAHWMREFGFEPSERRAALREEDRVPKAEPSPDPSPPKPTRRARTPRAPEPGVLGERLAVNLPPAPEEPPADPGPASPAAVGMGIDDGLEHDALDPVLAEAFEEWRGRLDPDDLDMDRWIDNVKPL